MSLFGISLPDLLLRIPAVLLALAVHETAHGYAALKLGDPTARNLGRLSLNPLKHLEPIGALCMLLFGFGWAKPVPINARYFKNPRRDMALTALSGPLSNFIMGFVAVLLYCVSITAFNALPAATGYLLSLELVLVQFLSIFIMLNVSLGVFNMLPVPPLDGSRIFLTFLPPKYYFAVMKYERYIMFGLLIALYVGLLDDVLSTLVNFVIDGMFFIVGLIPGL